MTPQQKLDRMHHANQLKANPVLAEVFTYLKAGYFEKLAKVKKGRGYEEDLKDIHESMQNLIRIENYIDRCVAEGKAVQAKKGKGPIDVQI